MMGRLTRGQGQLFYEFHLDDVVPADHLVRRIDAVLDLGWIHEELAPFYGNTGRPSIDPELMIRMLLVGYVRSGLSGGSVRRFGSIWRIAGCVVSASKIRFPTTPYSPAPGTSASARARGCGTCSSAWWPPASQPAWLAARRSRSTPA